MDKQVKVGAKVKIVGQALKANPHYKDKVGRVTQDLGHGAWEVFWEKSWTTICHTIDLEVA